MDSDEPDMHSNLDIPERTLRMGPTAMGPGAEFFNSYPLIHTQGVFEGERELNPDKRSFILSRSGFGGIQRNGVALWSGDVVARWDDLKDQISAGVNLSMSGIPNWTTDIGGFSVEDRYTNKDPAHWAEWQELNLRWFQFGAFSPLFRSHGETPFREIYNLADEGTEVYKALAWYDELRYRLMPYIYTLAADTYHHDGSMMRGLVMDFPADKTARDVNDEYLFGKAFLVAPVTAFKARSRGLPAGRRLLVRLRERQGVQGRPDDQGRRAAQPHAAVRAGRFDRADHGGPAICRRKARRAADRGGLCRRRRPLRPL
jgi:alpha-D-xyloside xylohydrolase